MQGTLLILDQCIRNIQIIVCQMCMLSMGSWARNYTPNLGMYAHGVRRLFRLKINVQNSRLRTNFQYVTINMCIYLQEENLGHDCMKNVRFESKHVQFLPPESSSILMLGVMLTNHVTEVKVYLLITADFNEYWYLTLN